MTDNVIGETALANLIAALEARDRVAGYTHDLYRYPARFPPSFVRVAVEAFTDPGDLVLDPFVGGGTSAVESLALGRRFLGTDLNQLAVFVSRAKTTMLSAGSAKRLLEWSAGLEDWISLRWEGTLHRDTRDTKVPSIVQRTLALAIEAALTLPSRRVRRLARATLLRAGQWALDGRREIPSRIELLRQHRIITERTVAGSLALTNAAREAFSGTLVEVESRRRILHSPAERLSDTGVIGKEGKHPRLVITSPPYHGVHILYHRWQVRGRRETPAPYWVSGCQDGKPASYYTFGGRVRKGACELRPEYFESALNAFRGIAQVCTPETVVLQLVGFSYPAVQLPMYLETMRNAGLRPVSLHDAFAKSGPFSRAVPNRKWYLDALKRFSPSSREFLLVHRRED